MITGTLVADFEDFTAATRAAKQNLADLEAQSAKLEKSLKDATNVSPGNLKTFGDETRKIGQTVSSTDALLDGMQSRLLTLFTVDKVLKFGAALVQTASDVTKLSQATGLTAEEVQRLQYVAAQTNAPLSALTSATQNMTLAIGTNSAGLRGALAQLGISFQDFIEMPTGQRLYEVAEALKKIDDPARQAALAATVFGKSWKEVLPAVNAGMTDIAKNANVMSDANIQALNRLEERWNGFKNAVIAAAGNIAGAMARAAEAGPIDPSGRSEAGSIPQDLMSELLPKVTGDAQKYVDTLKLIPPAVGAVVLDEKIWAEEQAAMALQLKAANAAVAQQEAELRAFDAAMVEINSVGGDWYETLAQISGETVAAVQYYLEAGVAQSTLATAYGLTATQIKAVSTARTEELAGLKAENEAFNEAAASRMAKTAAMQKEREEYSRIVTSTLEADKTTRDYYQMIAEKSATAYSFAQEHAESYTTARIEQLRLEAEAAKSTLESWSRDAGQSMSDVESAAGQAKTALASVNDEISKATTGAQQAANAMATFVGGSYATPESLAAAGRVPGSSLLVSRSIGLPPPSGLGMDWANRVAGISPPPSAFGVTLQQGAVQMNYPIMNDPQAMDQIGRVVGDAIMSRVTRPGQLV